MRRDLTEVDAKKRKKRCERPRKECIRSNVQDLFNRVPKVRGGKGGWQGGIYMKEGGSGAEKDGVRRML